MKLLFLASECVPFLKTGGLADVLGALPDALSRLGADARVMLPRYGLIPERYQKQMTHVCDFMMPFGGRERYVGVDTLMLGRVTYYFIDDRDFFDVPAIYGDGDAEALRFLFFDKAALESLMHIGFFPDVLHLNDWQTGMTAALLSVHFSRDARYAGVKTVFSIHNLRFQGLFPYELVQPLVQLPEWCYTSDFLEFYGRVSLMKAGLVFSDRIGTVSQSYAAEIRTAYYGERLEGVLQKRKDGLFGIVNGLDTRAWNPANDAFLAAPYSVRAPEGKAENKAALQAELGLAAAPDKPLIAMVTRLDAQKGLDLLDCVLDDILRMDVQLAVLGTGEKRFADRLCFAQWCYPGRVSARIEMNERLAHRIYAGADLFLMPSQFEPCGLSQMIALRYGALPVVRETGGLRDTVEPYNRYTGAGNGFSFANYNAHEMLYALENAVHVYYDEKDAWARLMRRGMQADFSWTPSARAYLAVYQSLMNGEEDGTKQ